LMRLAKVRASSFVRTPRADLIADKTVPSSVLMLFPVLTGAGGTGSFAFGVLGDFATGMRRR